MNTKNGFSLGPPGLPTVNAPQRRTKHYQATLVYCFAWLELTHRRAARLPSKAAILLYSHAAAVRQLPQRSGYVQAQPLSSKQLRFLFFYLWCVLKKYGDHFIFLSIFFPPFPPEIECTVYCTNNLKKKALSGAHWHPLCQLFQSRFRACRASWGWV